MQKSGYIHTGEGTNEAAAKVGKTEYEPCFGHEDLRGFGMNQGVSKASGCKETCDKPITPTFPSQKARWNINIWG